MCANSLYELIVQYTFPLHCMFVYGFIAVSVLL